MKLKHPELSVGKLNQKTTELLEKAVKFSKLPLETGIIPLVNALNGLDGVITNESCEGHPEKNQFPWVRFTLDNIETGMQSISLASVAASTFGWMLICQPELNVNPDKPEIPSLLKKKEISFCFLMLPYASAAEKDFLKNCFYSAPEAENVISEQHKIQSIAEFIFRHQSRFIFCLASPRKLI